MAVLFLTGCKKADEGYVLTKDFPFDFQEGDFKFNKFDDHVEVASHILAEKASGDIVIPETAGGLPVTGISTRAFCYAKGITSISSKSVKSVAFEAFEGVDATTVTFDSVIKIGSAFSGLKSLTTANFPNATEVGQSAFSGCSKLTGFNFSLITKIGHKAFAGCGVLTAVTVPSAPVCIGADAFDGCVWQPEDNGVTSVCP